MGRRDVRAFAAIFALVACSSTSSTRVVGDNCSPGSKDVCIDANDCQGTRVCSADGTGYGACVCADGGASGGADSGSGATAGSGGQAGGSSAAAGVGAAAGSGGAGGSGGAAGSAGAPNPCAGAPDGDRCDAALSNMRCCNETCVDTAKDDQNCGGCGLVCQLSGQCFKTWSKTDPTQVSGICGCAIEGGAQCPGGQTVCRLPLHGACHCTDDTQCATWQVCTTMNYSDSDAFNACFYQW
jgi:hypothetical protein